LSVFAEGVDRLNEFYLQSKEVVKTEKFTKFGLTDCGIINVARDVITDDLKLAHYLQKIGIDAINFNNSPLWMEGKWAIAPDLSYNMREIK